MTITLPGAAAADLASLDCSPEGKPDPAVGSTRQPLPSVTRQALPVRLREANYAKLLHIHAIDSNEKRNLDGSFVEVNLFGPTNATVSA
jgi:hypothetical protein